MARSREDVVITGLSCRFADAPTPGAFWRNIVEGRTSFRPFDFISREESARPIFDNYPPAFGAQLGSLYAFRPARAPLPEELEPGENPDRPFALQLVCDALRDAGLRPASLPTNRVSIRLGYAPPFNPASVNWLRRTVFLREAMGVLQSCLPEVEPARLEEVRRALASHLPATKAATLSSATGGGIATWMASQLRVRGPATAVDAAFLSFYAALQQAMDDLLRHRVDIAVCGAIQPPFSRARLEGLSGFLPFAPEGVLCPFCKETRGTLPGEGGAFFVLRRLNDAHRAESRVYAMVGGVGFAVGAPTRRGRTLPGAELSSAIEGALEQAEATPESIRLIEAHGSGVARLDTTELTTVGSLLGLGCAARAKVGIGSVKGNIGHTLVASGAAGVLKAALAVYSRTLPPQVKVEKPHASFEAADFPLYLLQETRPWIGGNARRTPRRALVESVDPSGSCACAILEQER